MYYQNYEDYMRSVLGYPASSPNIYENYDYRTSFNMNNMAGYSPTYQDVNQNMISNLSEDDIRSLYPDIYHLITPMVDKVCKANREPITRELIEKMTDEIYMAMEEQPDIVVNIRAEAKKVSEDLGSSSSNRKSLDSLNDGKKTENRSEKMGRRENVFAKKEELPQTPPKKAAESSLKREASSQNSQSSPREISETRQRNFVLRDLIKILLLNQLFGDGIPARPRPPRPPFLERPEMPQVRPPMGHRNASNAKRVF